MDGRATDRDRPLAGQDIYCVICLQTASAVRARTIVNGHSLCADHSKAAVRLSTTDPWLHKVIELTAHDRAAMKGLI